MRAGEVKKRNVMENKPKLDKSSLFPLSRKSTHSIDR